MWASAVDGCAAGLWQHRRMRDETTDWLLRLCAIDTTTGRETAVLPELRAILTGLGARLVEQPVREGGVNVLALWGRPRVLLSSHLDTVPPFIAPELRDGAVRGRGACDAKGQIVAQLGAIARLLEDGRRDVAWLGVVGEETDSAGARHAAEGLRSQLAACEAVINGEPTGLRLATGQRGVVHVKLRCTGETAHSALEGRGVHAIWSLVEWLRAARELPAGRDAELGSESWNLARVSGGVAPNVIPDAAEAEVLARTVPGSTLVARMRELAPARGALEVLSECDPCRFPAIEGFARAPVPYGSDAPRLRELARDGIVAMVGPGDIAVAHTDHEHLAIAELQAGVDLLERLVSQLLEAR